jgi:hypothetical protein
VNGLLGHPQAEGDVPPGPALLAGPVDLEFFQHLHQLPQRHHSGQAHFRVGTRRRVHEPPAFREIACDFVKID